MVTLDGTLGGRVGASYSSNPSNGNREVVSPVLSSFPAPPAAMGYNINNDTRGVAYPSGALGFSPSNYNMILSPFDLIVKMLDEPNGIQILLKQFKDAYFSLNSQSVSADGVGTVAKKPSPFNNSQIQPAAATLGKDLNYYKEQLAAAATILQGLQTGSGALFASAYNEEAAKRGIPRMLTTEQGDAYVEKALSENGKLALNALQNAQAEAARLDPILDGLKTKTDGYNTKLDSIASAGGPAGGATR